VILISRAKIKLILFCLVTIASVTCILLARGCCDSYSDLNAINKETHNLLDNVDAFFVYLGPDKLCIVKRGEESFDAACELVKHARTSCTFREIDLGTLAEGYDHRLVAVESKSSSLINEEYSVLFTMIYNYNGFVGTQAYGYRKIPEDRIQHIIDLWKVIEKSKQGNFMSSFPNFK